MKVLSLAILSQKGMNVPVALHVKKEEPWLKDLLFIITPNNYGAPWKGETFELNAVCATSETLFAPWGILTFKESNLIGNSSASISQITEYYSSI